MKPMIASGRRMGKNFSRVFIFVGLAVLSSLLAAPMCEKKSEGESAAQTAARQIKESLPLPKDTEYLGVSVLAGQDRLIYKFGSRLPLLDVSDFMASAAQGEVIYRGDNAVGYKDVQGRVINYAWFPRDPDLFPYSTAIDVAVTPIPKAIKKDQNIE